jgi:hypothetical protein
MGSSGGFNTRKLSSGNGPITLGSMLFGGGNAGAGSGRRIYSYYARQGYSANQFITMFLGKKNY